MLQPGWSFGICRLLRREDQKLNRNSLGRTTTGRFRRAQAGFTSDGARVPKRTEKAVRDETLRSHDPDHLRGGGHEPPMNDDALL